MRICYFCQFSGSQNELFDLIDTNNDDELSKDEVVAAAPLLGMSKQEAAQYFDTLAVGSNAISRKSFGGDFVDSFAKMFGPPLGTSPRQENSTQNLSETISLADAMPSSDSRVARGTAI